MKIHGKITQIQSDYGDVYVNILSPVGVGHVAIDFSIYQQPTYLLRNKSLSSLRLIVFASQEWADEWFEKYEGVFKSVERLDVQDTSVASSDGAEK